uniref:WD_REPEATS_REGION domain-containing protein n=1 Tax=Trichuris muris TaxID=70415 RepID=A0A5S6QGR9_TRIMR
MSLGLSERNEASDGDADGEDDFHSNSDDDVIYLNQDEVVLSDQSEEEEDSNDEASIDGSAVTFTKHTDTVFSIAIKGDIVITGGADNLAFAWNAHNGDLLAKLEGHRDSVVEVRLNHDQSYLATGDMRGVVIVWETQRWEVRSILESIDGMLDMNWMFWHHSANVIFRGFLSGQIAINTSSNSKFRFLPTHDSSCTCGKLLQDGVRLVAGYEDGLLKIWDLTNNTCVTVQGREPVNCVDVLDDRIGASGSENGTFALFSLTTGAIYASLSASQFSEALAPESCIETVAFDPTKSLLSVSGLDCPLIFFDVQSGRPRAVFANISSVTKAIWLNNCLLACCLDGVIRLWDSRSSQLRGEWHGHRSPIYDLAVNKERGFFVTGDKDGVCKVFPLHL